MTITLAESEADRRDALELFLDTFADIAENAVPMPEHDRLFAPLIAQVRDKDGALLGAALTCRPQIAAGMALMPGYDLGKADRVSELDLMAVHPDRRGEGIGRQMLDFLEPLLAARGVRSWFGNATHDLDLARLRNFYANAGFQVLAEGQPLPPFAGQDWTPPFAEAPAFYFWKRVRA
ncbi:GNAT family N-acetyltransferase [Nocardioides pakistanensis]